MMRADREDLSAQEARLEDARAEDDDALAALARAANDARKKRAPREEVHGAYARWRRAEEAVDIAALDLAGASGEDT